MPNPKAARMQDIDRAMLLHMDEVHYNAIQAGTHEYRLCIICQGLKAEWDRVRGS